MEERHVFESGTGIVTVTPTTITIQHKKGTYHGGKTKEIRIKSISAVEMKEPGRILAGYIQFVFSGGKEAGGRKVLDPVKNENTVMVAKKDFAKFRECKAIVDAYIDRAQSSAPAQVAAASEADELAKWVSLRDQGVITAEEFDAKKKQILGL